MFRSWGLCALTVLSSASGFGVWIDLFDKGKWKPALVRAFVAVAMNTRTSSDGLLGRRLTGRSLTRTRVAPSSA